MLADAQEREEQDAAARGSLSARSSSRGRKGGLARLAIKHGASEEPAGAKKLPGLEIAAANDEPGDAAVYMPSLLQWAS